MNDSMRLAHLETLRAHEIELVLQFLPPSGRILEIGAGAGWQARRLSERGYEVFALDVDDSRFKPTRVYPVKNYDGCHIPFPDNYFDVVYSSNVLEHVLELAELEKEISRVLAPKGIAVHILPTTAWRAWTIVTHPIYLLQAATQRWLSMQRPLRNKDSVASIKPSLSGLWRYLLPPRHGSRGSAIGELTQFSYRYWYRHFNSCGWEVALFSPCGLFYSGNQILHSRLEIGWRNRLARYLGSATALWILKEAPK